MHSSYDRQEEFLTAYYTEHFACKYILDQVWRKPVRRASSPPKIVFLIEVFSLHKFQNSKFACCAISGHLADSTKCCLLTWVNLSHTRFRDIQCLQLYRPLPRLWECSQSGVQNNKIVLQKRKFLLFCPPDWLHPTDKQGVYSDHFV